MGQLPKKRKAAKKRKRESSFRKPVGTSETDASRIIKPSQAHPCDPQASQQRLTVEKVTTMPKTQGAFSQTSYFQVGDNDSPVRSDRASTGQLGNQAQQDESPQEIDGPESSIEWDPVDPLGLFDRLEGPLDWPSGVYF